MTNARVKLEMQEGGKKLEKVGEDILYYAEVIAQKL